MISLLLGDFWQKLIHQNLNLKQRVSGKRTAKGLRRVPKG